MTASSTQVKSEFLSDLECWAQSEGFEEFLVILDSALGLSSLKNSRASVTIITEEVRKAASDKVLSSWSHNISVSLLQRFVERFYQWQGRHFYQNEFKFVGNKDAAKKLGTNLVGTHYLLSLLVTSLPAESKDNPALNSRRRMLRLWLLTHELNRIIASGFHGYKALSAAARYLTLDSEDEDVWALVDRFLNNAISLLGKESDSFDATNAAFSRSAAIIREERRESSRHAFNLFLGNIIAIANNDNTPAAQTNSLSSPVHLISTKLSASSLASTPPLMTEDDGIEYEFAETDKSESLIESSLDNEDNDSILIVDVDTNQTEAAQLIESNAVFLQTAEQAQCLPWSWDNILPAEEQQFNEWINQLLASDLQDHQIAGALCSIALQTGRSLELVLRLQINESVLPEWAIEPDFRVLKRQVLRRQNSWEPKAVDQLDYIASYSEEVSLLVSPLVRRVLENTAARLTFTPLSLTDIWKAVSTDNIAVWFTKNLPENLERLTSGKLFNFLQQEIFNATADHNLARAYSAHPKAGLPAACSYSSWNIEAIEKGINHPINDGLHKETFIIGSRLNPLEDYLVSKIQQAYQSLSSATGLIKYHNLLAQYVCAALYASTGCRYLQDPFESLSHFNLETGIVFINDKSDDNKHQGRIAPLAFGAIELLRVYLTHLQNLSKAIELTSPDFSAAINQLISPNRQEAARLPLFFLIDHSGQWQSISSAQELGVDAFAWELPANLFRHRFAQQLSNHGVNAEVVDGWMGHSERNAASYSDTSVRCRKDDIRHFAHAVNSIFDTLAFELPIADDLKAQSHLPTLQLQDKLFGEALRKKNREQTLEGAKETAFRDIALFLGAKSIDEIDEDRISKICKMMLYKDGQIAHHFAALRLNLFREKLEASDNELKSSIRKRVLETSRQTSKLKDTISQAVSVYGRLKKWREKVFWSQSRGSKIEAAMVGTLLLAIEKRISYRQLLDDVFAGKNFRLIQHKKNCYIEYNEELDDSNHFHQPVQRHQISYQTASALAFAKGRKQSELSGNIFDNELLAELEDILEFHSTANFNDLLESVTYCIDQANLFDLPGFVASALAGRILSTSLPFDDWIRASTGKPVLVPLVTTTEEDNIELSSLLSGKIVSNDSELLRQSTRNFKQELTQLISSYQATPSQAKSFANKVEKLCSAREGSVSTSILLAGFWIAFIAKKGKGRSKTLKPFASSTIQTYFSSLFTPFEQLAYDVDITTLDSDDLTDLWQKMIEFRRLKQNDEEYFSKRLLGFNRFAIQHGVEMAEWAELQVNEVTRTVRAGFITEDDYQQTLAHILKSYDDLQQARAIAFILLLGYRFGLRLKEAIGLLRKDLCSYQNKTWVLVRNNRFRKLKTHNSRRAVPLLFELSDTEKNLIESIKTQSEAISGRNKNTPLIGEIVDGKLQIVSFEGLISPAAIQALREVTGSLNLVFHHARHSFFNNAATALMDIDAEVITKQRKHINNEKIKRIVLGQQHENGRRSTSALARLMGHHTPHTSLKNYSHLVLEWADTLVPTASFKTYQIDGALNMNDLKRYKTPKTMKVALNYQPLTLSKTIQLLRLVALGKSFEYSGTQLQIEPSYTQKIAELFFQANRKMYFIQRGSKETIAGEEHQNLVLKYISNDAWLRMLELSAKADSNLSTLNLATDKVENLLGSHRRQLLLKDEEHAKLLRLFIDTFELDPSCYSICATNDDKALLELLKNQNLPTKMLDQASSTGKKLVLDTFKIYEDGELESTIKKYIVFDMHRNDSQVLRNSLEMVVAFLALASLVT